MIKLKLIAVRIFVVVIKEKLTNSLDFSKDTCEGDYNVISSMAMGTFRRSTHSRVIRRHYEEIIWIGANYEERKSYEALP